MTDERAGGLTGDPVTRPGAECLSGLLGEERDVSSLGKAAPRAGGRRTFASAFDWEGGGQRADVAPSEAAGLRGEPPRDLLTRRGGGSPTLGGSTP